MKNKKVVKEWFEKGEEDFQFACKAIELGNFFAQICFHFQQSAEKYLKALIIAYDLEFRAVHNLLELLRICKQKVPEIGELEEPCRYLNPFYIDTRYPVHWPSHYNKETALTAKRHAEKIRDWIKTHLHL